MPDITSVCSGTAPAIAASPKGRSVETQDHGTAIRPLVPPLETSRRRLAEICKEYHLDTMHVVGVLSAHGIRAAPGLTLRQISETNATSVNRVYRLVRLSTRS